MLPLPHSTDGMPAYERQVQEVTSTAWLSCCSSGKGVPACRAPCNVPRLPLAVLSASQLPCCGPHPVCGPRVGAAPQQRLDHICMTPCCRQVQRTAAILQSWSGWLVGTFCLFVLVWLPCMQLLHCWVVGWHAMVSRGPVTSTAATSEQCQRHACAAIGVLHCPDMCSRDGKVSHSCCTQGLGRECGLCCRTGHCPCHVLLLLQLRCSRDQQTGTMSYLLLCSPLL